MKSHEPFAFTGLWDVWRSPDGSELASFTIIMTEANEPLKPIHDRMPVILRPEDEEWLDAGPVDAAKLAPLLKPCPAGEMESYDVSMRVNSPKNDDPTCITPAQDASTLLVPTAEFPCNK